MNQLPIPVRADPFALDSLEDFKPAPAPKLKPEPSAIREVSEANNFPSRAAGQRTKTEALESKPQRRHRTGRNVQFNIKATAATVERFTKLAEVQGWVFGEALDRALDALEASLVMKSR